MIVGFGLFLGIVSIWTAAAGYGVDPEHVGVQVGVLWGTRMVVWWRWGGNGGGGGGGSGSCINGVGPR